MPYKYLAAVDMGTNSFRLIIARVDEEGSFKIIHKEKELIRLASHEGKGLSLITDAEINTAIKALKKFKAIAEFYHAPVRAVATSATREAKNKHEFITQIKKETGIDVEVIEGHHEARLIFQGVQSAVPLNNKKVFCIDIGGGSTEFIFAENCKVNLTESIRLGAVRLTKKFFPDFVVNEYSLRKCGEYIEEHIANNKNLKTNEKFDIAVGSSGTILATAGLVYYINNNKRKRAINGLTFSKDELVEVSDYIFSKHTFEQRLKIKGLEKKRADIYPAGILILRKAFDIFKLESMIVSEYALRTGIIIDTIHKLKLKK
jgi:exopolyphosphatase/guanosine-5'-triphosphate,3'-diphosphate pyrophosphatase